jgi:low affinity Fe/Cu permease
MEKERSLSEGFQVFATKSSYWVGSRWAFALAVMAIILWAGTGPHFHYSDTWQLVVNTATTIVTFLMVFLIQSAPESSLFYHFRGNHRCSRAS